MLVNSPVINHPMLNSDFSIHREIMVRTYAVERRINNLREVANPISPLFSIRLYFNCVSPNGNAKDWLGILETTEKNFDIMGVALGAWRRTRKFKSTVLQKAETGCKVRILLMHKENPALEGIIYAPDKEESFESIVTDIDQSFAFYNSKPVAR